MTGTGRLFFIGMLVCLLGACASPKDVVYLQDVKINSRVKAALQYRTVIHVDDLLSIVVSCDDIETALPFNTPMIGLGQNNTRTGNDQLYGYLVDTDGTIDFPVLGKIKVEGLSRTELAVGGNVEREVVGVLEEPDRDYPVLEFQGNRVGGSESSRELQGE